MQHSQLFDLYRSHLENCLNKADRFISKIGKDILEIEGMSGKKTRHFYNNLLELKDSRYLEIGTWKGSSVCSAMFQNEARVVCIDNWSEFDGPKSEFLTNLETFKGQNNVTFYEIDCFSIDTNTLPNFNIYLFDGSHEESSHVKALSHFLPVLDDIFIFIVDDWNHFDVRNGTRKSIKQNNLTVLFEKEIRLTTDESHTPQPEASETWWNGIYVSILKKNH